jgi:hypothetical protein
MASLMALTTKTELRKEYLYVLVEGEFEYLSSIQSTDAILEACARHQTTKALIDFRGVTGKIIDIERFHYAEVSTDKYNKLLAAGVVKPCRFVWIGKPPQLDPKKLGESVALNRGLILRVTPDLEHAFVFLGVKPDME